MSPGTVFIGIFKFQGKENREAHRAGRFRGVPPSPPMRRPLLPCR
jgi:hypothetical protein